MSFLLDTNVLSELRKGPQANKNVRAWDESVGGESCFTSVIVIAELLKGADTVIGALCRLRTRFPRRQAMHKALASFREHRHRMRYADLQARH